MKYTSTFLIGGILVTFLSNCNNILKQQTASLNKDSVEAAIMDIHIKMMDARNKGTKEGQAAFASYCDDSLLCSENSTFMTSAYALSQDLINGSIVPPHDYIFRLMGNTALLSYLETTYELIGYDTAFQNRRITKVFVLKNDIWKMGGIFINPEQTNNYTNAVTEKNQRYYSEYAGIYQWKPNMADTFFVKDGKLYDAMTDSPATPSFPVSDSEYMSKSDLGRVIFGRNAKGKVSYYTYVLTDGQRVRIPKVK
jgi:hypothetical protein